MNGEKFIDHVLNGIYYSRKVSSISRHNFEANLCANFERLLLRSPQPSKDELTNCLEDVLFGMNMEEVVYFRYNVLNFN